MIQILMQVTIDYLVKSKIPIDRKWIDSIRLETEDGIKYNKLKQ